MSAQVTKYAGREPLKDIAIRPGTKGEPLMGTTSTDNARVERISAQSRLTRTEARHAEVSAGETPEPDYSFRPAADEPQTADQRLPLLVVLLASFFLLGVSAGWPPAEPNGQAAQLVTKAQPKGVTEMAPVDFSQVPEATTIP